MYRKGDLLAVMSAGAYGFAMSSNYCSRPKVPEVMVKEDTYSVTNRRQSYEDLIRNESIPDFCWKQILINMKKILYHESTKGQKHEKDQEKFRVFVIAFNVLSQTNISMKRSIWKEMKKYLSTR